MTHDDETPVDGRGPLELILDGVNKTRTCQLAMHEELKSYHREVQSLKQRIHVPVAVCVVSALVCLGSVFARFAP